MARGDLLDDGSGPVIGTAVGDDHLVAVCRVVLVEHRVEAGLDVALLVIDRDDHTDVWLALFRPFHCGHIVIGNGQRRAVRGTAAQCADQRVGLPR